MSRMENNLDPLMRALGFDGPIHSDFFVPIPNQGILRHSVDTGDSLPRDNDHDQNEFAELCS